MKPLRNALLVLAGAYLLILLAFFVFQRSLLYYPSANFYSLREAHASPDFYSLREAHASPAFKQLSIQTEDGIALKAWYAPATSKPFTLVFFHGNADSLATASSVADPYIAAGYGFLVAEYRGYSGLEGKPTETGLYADGRACMTALIAQGVKSQDILLFGHSLGTGVAVQMAEEFHVGGLILLAPYLSIPKIAQVHYPFIPAQLLALDRFNNAAKISSIHAPLLIVNGLNDQIVPPSQGKQLFELASDPREFHTLPHHDHNDLFDAAAPIVLDWVTRACGRG
jgi:fermentation-respiration switch protein FrsA (DUF1100 family)